MAENKSFFQRKKRLIIVLAVVAVIVVIVMVNLKAQREKTVKVTLETVKRQDLTSIISASGEIKPKKSVDISAQVPGRIIKIGIEEGQEITAGTFLLQLDSTQYEANADRDRAMIMSMNAQLIQAEALYLRDKNIFERQSRLFDEELISRDQLESAKAQHDVSAAQLNAIKSQISQAEASLKSTLDNLSKTTYVSLIDGIVTSLQVEEGEVAIIGTMNNPGTVLLTIADLSVMEVEVEVDETDVVAVRIGQESNVRVDAYPDVVFVGKVTEVGSSALQRLSGGVSTQESKDFKVVVTLENPAYRLKPGLSASADVITAEIKDALVVPISALVVRETDEMDPDRPNAKKEEEGIYVTEDSRAKFLPVEKGIMGGMMIEIKSGLQENQEIISGPYAALREIKEGVLVKGDEAKKDAKKPS
jgi:HlyD family secretion protein